nr:molybdenum cofactor guanylyltransferase [Devosia oryzisoli]
MILAGGAGERLGGVRKAELRVGGKRLVDRVAGRLAAHAEVLLAVRHPAPRAPALSTINDNLAFGGPMAGIAAALEVLSDRPDDDIVLTVAVDTPFLPADYGARLLVPLFQSSSEAAAAGWRDQWYPTNAAYRLGALRRRPLPDRPRRLLEALGAASVAWDEQPRNPFANLNTVDDLIDLQRQAQLSGR